MADKYKTSFGNIALKVTPVEMNRTASSVEKKINSAKLVFEELIKKAIDTSIYWEGDVSSKRRILFKRQESKFGDKLNNLSNYVSELRIITSQYEDTEEQLRQLPESLPIDIFG